VINHIIYDEPKIIGGSYPFLLSIYIDQSEIIPRMLLSQNTLIEHHIPVLLGAGELNAFSASISQNLKLNTTKKGKKDGGTKTL
jgi:hypothetical protein